MKFKIYISIFIIALFASVIYGVKLLYPLLVGLIIFSYDAWEKGFSPREIFKMMVDGISIVQKVIIIFLLIGVITAAWRLSGTIPYLVYHGASLINPNLFYLYTFLLNLGMSMLLGSVNGTATTMGIVLISLARANGSSLVITTGAILSGAMFGDRLSPVSSSINLVAEITETDVIKNRKPMTHSVIIPTIITMIIYLLISLSSGGKTTDVELLEGIRSNTNLNVISVLPALVVIILSLFKMGTRKLLIISSIFSIIIGYTYQNYKVDEIVRGLIFGVEVENLSLSLSRIINGGGIKSMFHTSLNVGISAMYFGIFQKTEFLKPVENIIDRLENKIGFYWTYVLVALVFSILFGTQSIVVILIAGIYKERVSSNELLMLDLENVSILLPALIPWNMAANLALTVYQVSYFSVLFNFFCMVVPIYYYFYRKKFKIKLDKVM